MIPRRNGSTPEFAILRLRPQRRHRWRRPPSRPLINRRIVRNTVAVNYLGDIACARPADTWRDGVVVAVSLAFTEFEAATGKASWQKSDTPSLQAPPQTTLSARCW